MQNVLKLLIALSISAGKCLYIQIHVCREAVLHLYWIGWSDLLLTRYIACVSGDLCTLRSLCSVILINQYQMQRLRPYKNTLLDSHPPHLPKWRYKQYQVYILFLAKCYFKDRGTGQTTRPQVYIVRSQHTGKQLSFMTSMSLLPHKITAQTIKNSLQVGMRI